ncbi:hypothetical protein Y032_0272g959 [Ancylostoma ceylanicum]|uniref:Uncharacterized protein n=1 Tax=Ancylostoma ceylanicum TaxID=53326 RepID=A0A016S8B4_9BILA|nr:hypothetical protein Y032_0272g959 [Ancylostoma ceylanicum]
MKLVRSPSKTGKTVEYKRTSGADANVRLNIKSKLYAHISLIFIVCQIRGVVRSHRPPCRVAYCWQSPNSQPAEF